MKFIFISIVYEKVINTEIDQVKFAICAIFGIVIAATIVSVYVTDNQLLSNIIMGAIGAIAGLAGNEAIKKE